MDLKPLLYGRDLDELKTWLKSHDMPAWRAEQIAGWAASDVLIGAGFG